jgi:MFS family permease
MGMRCLATVFYGMLTILIPLLLNDVTGSKAAVAAYGTSTLIVASVVQLLAGRAADRSGARVPTLLAFGCVVLASAGLALAHGTAWGLFLFGITGVAAAWALSTLMYIWVVDGVAPPDRPSSFGLLHVVWSLSMILGSLLGGWLVGTWPGLPFLVAGLGNVAALFLTQAFYGRIRRQASPPGPA